MNRFTAVLHVMKSAIRRHSSIGLRGLVAITLVLSVAFTPQLGRAAPQVTTWYVSPSGDNANDCLTPLTACLDISSALDRAGDGDTINVAAGIYAKTLIIDKSVTLQGADQATTFIDGQALGRVVQINNATVNLSGLTVRNGQSGYGAGLFIGSSAVVNISNSSISQNSSSGGGAGIYNQGRLKLVNVILSHNTNTGNDNGGGLRNLGTAELINSEISNNQSVSNAGGIYNRGVVTLTNSTLSNNQAAAGGAIYNQSLLALNGSTLSHNQAQTNSGGAIYNAGLADPGIVIDAGSLITDNVAATSGGGIHNTLNGKLTFNNTRLISNTAASFGGGLYSDSVGAVTLDNVTVTDNRAGVSGGGLYSANISGTLTVNRGQIGNNQSVANGGGLYNEGTALLASVNVNNNRSNSGGGGGIYNETGWLTLAQAELTGNSATIGNGGGLFNGATASLNSIIIQSNQSASGGGLYNDLSGNMQLATSSVYRNNALQSTGGGISNRGALTLTQSALYSNTTTLQGGSGLYNNASAQLANVTLSYNSVLSATTGAILNDGGTLNILNTTISHNRWPALARTGGSLVLANTIVAASSGGINCSGQMTSNGYNLDSGNSCGFNAVGDINNTDPLLGPLTNNGGATLTRILQVGSRAIEGGNNTTCPATDQRGVTRPQGDKCDMGAYENIGYSTNITKTAASQTCISSTQVVSSPYLIGALHVGVNLAFQPRGDLRVNLYSPTKIKINLLGNTGGNGQNLDVLWDDDSPFGPVGDENQDVNFPYYKYVRVPDQSLSPVFGHGLRGTWWLEVCNLSSEVTNVATLNNWSLIVTSVGNPKVYMPVLRRK